MLFNLCFFLKQGVKRMKIAEALAFCGDRGVYLLARLDLHPDLKEEFTTVLQCSNSFIKKVTAPGELEELQKKFVFVLTQLEIWLPLYWNTSTRHFLLHIVDCVTKIGHFWSFSMLGVERIHITIKQLARYGTIFCLCRCLCLSVSRSLSHTLTHTTTQGQEKCFVLPRQKPRY
jgi:hypothetical protein